MNADASWKKELRKATALYAGAALIFTWPLVWHIASSIPSGSEPSTVALFNLYVLEHTGHALSHGQPYWDAGIFWPHSGTLAWSETQPFTGFLFCLLHAVTGQPFLAYNLLFLAYLVFQGTATYALARQLTEDRIAAFASGLWLAVGGYAMHQAAVIHLLAGGFPIACLAFVLSLARGFRPFALWGAAVAYVLTWLTCAQFGVFLTFLLPVGVAFLIPWKTPWDRRAVLMILGACAAAAFICLLFLLPQKAHLDQMGFERPHEEVLGTLDVFPDPVLPAHGHWLTTRLLHADADPNVYSWDLGVVLILIWLIAASLARFRISGWYATPRGVAPALAVIALASLLIAFGGRLSIFGFAPYWILHDLFPGWSGIRSPARIVFFTTVGLAILAAPAIAYIRHHRYVTGTLFVLLAAEVWTMPIPLADGARGIKDHEIALEWLKQHKDDGAVLELPLAEGTTPAHLEREVLAMRRARVHNHPIVNGYSGHFPEPFWQLAVAVAEDQTGRGRRYIGALGVRHVLVHLHDLPDTAGNVVRQMFGSEPAAAFGQDWLFSLRPGKPPPSVKFPERTKLRTAPSAGDILRLAIRPPEAATLLLPESDRRVTIEWKGVHGYPETRTVRVLGSVILDAREEHVHLQILHLSRSWGTARLVSTERVKQKTRSARP
ncbi:MAG: hypothetical protein HYY16_03430 [Planctomycetes bacterium]|nr:hypothetical protein [Planctomycetota bacterium]